MGWHDPAVHICPSGQHTQLHGGCPLGQVAASQRLLRHTWSHAQPPAQAGAEQV